MFWMMTDGDIRVGPATSAAVGRGRLIQLLDITAVSLDGAGEVDVAVLHGADLDDDWTDNFSGAEPFEVVPLDGADAALGGTVDRGQLVAGPGVVPLLFAFIERSQAVALHGYTARIDATIAPDGTVDGRVAAAIAVAEAEQVLYPWLAGAMNEIIARDCPTPTTCAQGSSGESMLLYFDQYQDGTISSTELDENVAVGGRFNSPDLDVLDGDGHPGQDGVLDAVSFGFGFHAVPAVVAE